MKRILIRILCLIPAIVMMLLIFRLSMDTGEESAGLSDKVSIYLVRTVNNMFGLDWTEEELTVYKDQTAPFVRKAAHVTEYALLTCAVALAARGTFRASWRRLPFYSGVFTLLYAGSDELHQWFVSGRSGKFADVLVDGIGIAAAVLVIWFIFCRKQKA